MVKHRIFGMAGPGIPLRWIKRIDTCPSLTTDSNGDHSRAGSYPGRVVPTGYGVFPERPAELWFIVYGTSFIQKPTLGNRDLMEVFPCKPGRSASRHIRCVLSSLWIPDSDLSGLQIK